MPDRLDYNTIFDNFMGSGQGSAIQDIYKIIPVLDGPQIQILNSLELPEGLHFEFLKRLRMSLEIMANPDVESSIVIQRIVKQDEEEQAKLAELFRKVESGELDC